MTVRFSCLALFLSLLAGSASGVDSKACGGCHAAIYQRYLASPMARTSGVVDAATAPVSGRVQFTDDSTGTHFRIERAGGGAAVKFWQGEARGEMGLSYFVGAGLIGRSYASSIDGFLWQTPVSYYASSNQWGLSPGFEGSGRINLTRPVEPGCLNCHASGLRPVAGTVSAYERPPFSEAGVSCERCHGPGEAHMARMRSGDAQHSPGVVNPAKLGAAERESICAQCHLLSVVRIAKAGSGGSYAPGRRLFDSTAAFVWNDRAPRTGANSHFDQLVTSACWRGSAGKLWCGSCHDVHGDVPVAERRATYRQRCLSCHEPASKDCNAPADQRAAAKDDCVGCHMPGAPVGTVPHAAQVDHTISRVPQRAPDPAAAEKALLIPFPGSTGGDRELGLAYASEALAENNRSWGMRAVGLLEREAAEHPDDGAVSEQLGQLYDRMRQSEQACRWFDRAVKGVTGAAAFVNLGACVAKRGDLDAAMKLWSEALQRNPALEAARLNLAVAQFQSGDAEKARANLEAALRFDPFSRRARELLVMVSGK